MTRTHRPSTLNPDARTAIPSTVRARGQGALPSVELQTVHFSKTCAPATPWPPAALTTTFTGVGKGSAHL